MASLPRIACITITHSRIAMLERSMDCFVRQTYANKESIVFFTAQDQATAEFVNANRQYNFSHLCQLDTSGDVFLVSAENEMKPFKELVSGDKVCLKNKKGSYLRFNEQGKISWDGMRDPSSIIELVEQDSHFYLKDAQGHWIKVSADRELIIMENQSDAEIATVLMANSTTKLIAKELMEKTDRLATMGFDLQVIRNVSSPVTFVQLFAHEAVSLGAKRNLAMECTSAEYICVWDDDDWYDEKRLAYQMGFLQFTQKVACSMANTVLFDHNTNQGYINGLRKEGWEQTLLCKKEEMAYYGNLDRSEDTPVLKDLYEWNKLAVIEEPSLYIYNVHASNTSPSEHFLRMINNYQTQRLSSAENDEILHKLMS